MILVRRTSAITRLPQIWTKARNVDPSKPHPTREVMTSYLTDPENIGQRQKGVNFDTLGSWNNRLNLPILVEESIKKGKPIPRIPLEEVGQASLLGRRKKNEDRYINMELSPDLLMFAVFDGHCGHLASEFVCTHMVDHLRFWLQQTSELTRVLANSFTDVNNSLAKHLRNHHLNSEFYNSGTTATVCLLRNSTELVLGHVGDSRAIMCREGQARRLTTDHEPENKSEVERIKMSGGRIIVDSLGRSLVNGRLTMTRSIGDMDLKPYGVCATPQVKSVEVQHGKDAFLILITDGVSFVLNDQELVDIVSCCIVPSEAAMLVADQALQFGSDDNSTAVVIPFGAWGKYQSSTASIPYSFGRNLSSTRYR